MTIRRWYHDFINLIVLLDCQLGLNVLMVNLLWLTVCSILTVFFSLLTIFVILFHYTLHLTGFDWRKIILKIALLYLMTQELQSE